MPDRVVEGLKARIAVPAESRPSHGEEVRRLSAVLRAGQQIERDYPDAANLHLVRSTMLVAARQLAVLEADEASQVRLTDLAQRIVALPGPPEGKIFADFLLTQSRLARLGAGNRAASAEITRFASAYADSPVARIALMFAVEMATKADDERLINTLTTSLLKYRHEPEVEGFLRNRGVPIFLGASFNASLTTLDGTKLRLPRDLLGKVTVLHFWSITARDVPLMRAFYDQNHDRGVELIGINVDRDREKVESFIRQQGLSWPQVFTGKGLADPLLKRLGIPSIPYCWVTGWDGRIVQASVDDAGQHSRAARGMIEQVELQLETLTDLAERVPYYRSGEFLARTPLLRRASADGKDSIPQAALDAVETKLLVSPWAGSSREEKVQSFKAAFAAGQALEQRRPAAANLALVRSWMLIAARWLAVTTGDTAFAGRSVAVANRLLGSNAPPASRLLADYVLTSAQLAEMEPRSKAGARLIQDYAARHVGSDAAWAAGILAVMLTLEHAQDIVRETLIEQLRAAHQQRANPMVYGFLRDCCQQKFCGGGRGPSLHVPPLNRMDGGRLTLPDDLPGKVVILQFWSAAHPPQPALWDEYDEALPYTGLASVPSTGVVVVGINLDRKRADAEAFLKKSRYPDWIHTFSGLGWDDPTARACDILALPRTIVLSRFGEIGVDNQLDAVSFHHAVHGLAKQPAPQRGRR